MQTNCPDSLFDYVEAFQILRASRAVNEALGGWLRASEMYPMMAQRTILTKLKGMGDCGMNGALLVLEDAVEQKVSSSNSLDYMSLAMQSLKDWVKSCDGQPRRWHHFIYWPSSLPERYVEAVRQDENLALVLFLYWLAILRMAPPRWFMERWIIRAAHHIKGKLFFEWDELTAWPISIINMGRDELSFQSKRPTIDAT
ncbi:hypothetical protein GRF29_19g432516 [Pseudopithomyces chartarum]|uniref:Uncharacterized protein n=1 Tax=Pseudopithomyces chartarum TaxID=1892770 RepID=A0AAN6M3E5_9PLEO|nr:hypothetical protein GRF29_19g432516 [Pseudopithomyces chartarum]